MFISLFKNLFFLLVTFTFVTSAFATNATDPANRARALYYYVVGPPAGGYPIGYSGPAGPSTGLLDYFNSIIYDASVEQAFTDTGVSSCSQIPDFGNLALPGHSLGNISFEYTVGKKTIPAHFLKSSGNVFQKGIKVFLGTTHIASIEMNCPDSGRTVTGYMSRQDGTRQVEVYFQYEVGSKRRQLDIFSTNAAVDDEKFAARIETTDGVDYKIWGVKTSDGADGSFGVAVSGNKNNKKANIKVVKDTDVNPDNTVTVDDGVLKCVDLNNNTEDTGVSACPVAVEDPGKSVKGDDFSIQATSNVVVDTPDPLVADETIYDFGDIAMSTIATKLITITNSNSDSALNLSATPLAAPFSFTGGAYPGAGGDCAATLASGASCTIEVQVEAFFSGPMFGGFELQYDINSTPVVSNITGITFTANGISTTSGANLILSDADPYDFGDVAISSSVYKTFTLANTGGSTASNITASGIVFPLEFKGGVYPGTGGDCGAALPPGAVCTLVISFSPTSAGLFTGALTLSYSGNVASLVRNFQGTGTSTALLVVTDAGTSPIDFGNVIVNGSTTKILTVENVGSVPATSIVDGGLIAPFSFSGGAYPGTVGTCGAILAGGASCTVSVDFDPATVGTHAGYIDLSYNDGASTINSEVDVFGYATSAAALAFNDINPYDFGAVAVGSVTEYTFTLANYGAEVATSFAPLSLTSPFSFKGGGFPGTGGDCSTSLAPSVTCTIVVEYAPTAVGTDSDDLEISYNDGDAVSNAVVTINGSAGNANLSISDSPTYDFGTMSVGVSAIHTFTLTNTGTVAATTLNSFGLAAPFTFPGGGFPGVGGTCGVSLPGGASCTFAIKFSPIANGVVTDTLEIDYSDGVTGFNVTIDVSGEGSSAASLVISESEPFDYGNVVIGSTQEHTFVISNVGATVATAITESGILAPFEYPGGNYPGIGATCGASLAPGSTCTVVVAYSPVSAVVRSESLSITYNDGATTQIVSRSLTGTGVTPALLSISEVDPYDYGSVVVGTNSVHTFVVTNSGGQVASAITETGLSGMFSFFGAGYPGTGGTCTTTLAAGASCDLVVKFSPISAVTANGTITLDYNDGASIQSQSRMLVGTGNTAAVLAISDGPSYNFGNVVVGSPSSHTLVITNVGGAAAVSLSGAGLSAPFEFEGGGTFPGATGTCSSTLAPSATCTVAVTFAPTTNGSVSDGLEISYYDGTVTQNIVRDVLGNGASPALITISDVDPYDFGSISVGGSFNHTFTLTNSGGVIATGISGTGLAAPYSFKGGSFPGIGATCGATLAPATTCTVIVDFAPTLTGVASDTFDINYFDGVGAQLSSRSLTGTGVNAALLTISEIDPYDYGNITVGSSALHTLVITNTGGSSATSISAAGLSAPFNFVGGSFPGTGGTCATNLAPSASCDVVVVFEPVSVGNANASISIDYSDGSATQSAVRNVTGEGVGPASLVISGANPYDYGAVTVGSSNSHIFTVTNVGSSTATAIVGNGLAVPFRFTGGLFPGNSGTCSASLVAAGSCDIEVEFAPTASGVHNDTLLLNYNDGSNSQVTNKDLTGAGN